ncbi:K02A2.6-like [Cordylochernes scorpioides]|uniref:K02A2.6-like n=1 Tax=Cordylochernes scorpioides TaxID=51811 RepID=A0ABY6KAC6_9ARAC|nr:K02A2.6-like [Cordylochernes scorpioides]
MQVESPCQASVSGLHAGDGIDYLPIDATIAQMKVCLSRFVSSYHAAWLRDGLLARPVFVMAWVTCNIRCQLQLVLHASKADCGVDLSSMSLLGQKARRFVALDAMCDIGGHDSLDESQKEKLRNLLHNHTDIFEFSKRIQFKDVNVKHRINTGDHLLTKQRPYRVAPRERQIIQDNKMEKLDIIQSSESPWASPVILIRKKDGSWRFCVDYRRLNKITEKDVYPLPRIDDTLDCLRGARFYSSMDLQSGYW